MNDMPRQDVRQTALVPGWEIAKASSDVAQKVCNQSQAVSKALMDWNSECSRFIAHRISRTSEAVAQFTECQDLPAVFALQTQWFQNTIDDYLNETNKLMEANSKVICNMVMQFRDGRQTSVASTTVAE